MLGGFIPARNTGFCSECAGWYQKHKDTTLADIKFHCYALSDQCRLILNRYMNGSEAAAPSNSTQNIVNHLFSLSELESYFTRYFSNMASLIQPRSVYSRDDVVQQIQTYILRNYQKEINQEFISCLFNLNRSYLSTLFKERTGKKFVDYLNEVRISHSQELLSKSNQKLYQVARSVGLYNRNTNNRDAETIMPIILQERLTLLLLSNIRS